MRGSLVREKTPVNTRGVGTDHIAVKRVLLIFEAHPGLQAWSLRVFRDGSVRVLGMEPIFPKRVQWVFYDFRSTRKSLGARSAPPLPASTR
jgi:hypothetical protein